MLDLIFRKHPTVLTIYLKSVMLEKWQNDVEKM
jgi:hypothetical protein